MTFLSASHSLVYSILLVVVYEYLQSRQLALIIDAILLFRRGLNPICTAGFYRVDDTYEH